MGEFRLLSYNIRKGQGPMGSSVRDLARLAVAVREQQPDLLLCQEVFHPHDGLEQSRHLGAHLGMEVYYHPNKHRAVGHHGNATFSNLPVDKSFNHDVSQNALERRGILYVRTQVDGTSVHVLNVHLSLTHRQRVVQVQMLNSLLSEHTLGHEPVLVAGDFNDWRGKLDHHMTVDLGLSNLVTTQHGSHINTWHALRPVFALDRIYARHLICHDVHALGGEPWTSLSDHLPLLARLSIR
jgi:endonuclease/exonuclease/phosphatase family metal-dependent hydrolase